MLPFRNTPLHYAVVISYMPIIELLIKHNASINCHNNLGESILYYAAIMGNQEIVEFLINHGAAINQQNISGRTALHLTSSKGYFEATQLLIDQGADPNIKDNIGKTALHYAAADNHTDIMKCLILHGAILTPETKRRAFRISKDFAQELEKLTLEYEHKNAYKTLDKVHDHTSKESDTKANRLTTTNNIEEIIKSGPKAPLSYIINQNQQRQELKQISI
ncbi:Ankyrin repeat protein [Rickettsiales bacterium Ac37b]|nr:Ankyrin repeat protein [Rickettsiales bacterium Ac37b]